MGVRKRKASQDLKTNPLNKESKLESEDDVSDARGAIKDGDSATQNGAAAAQATAAVGDNGAELAKKKQNAITRTVWTLIMIFGFFGKLSIPDAKPSLSF